MKQFILVLVAMVAFGVTYAQNLSLRNETRVTLAINWSEASIMGYNEKEVVNFEKDWNKDQPVLLKKMVDAYNKKMGWTLPGITEFESNYTLELRPLVVRAKDDITCYAVIKDREGNVVAQMDKFHAEGSHVGTFLHGLGNSLKDAGEKMAKKIRKQYLK
ncbi:MAG: hypothetical protein J6Y99_00965 [Bacteroidales bacterium]|nr:hypothetical protein [Bacteroidales bacterium]